MQIRNRRPRSRPRLTLQLSRRVRTFVLVMSLLIGVGGILTAGVASAAALPSAPLGLVADRAAAVVASSTSGPAHEPVIERYVAGGVGVLLFGTMISVVVMSWRSFRETVESNRPRRED